MRIAIIGVGRMGQRHIQVVKDLYHPLVGISDMSPEALASAGKAHDVPKERQFGDASTMLKKTKPECVVVATTSPTHCEYTCLAAELGASYILCEKPMGVSLAECDRMIDACKAMGTKLAINHQMRFMPQYTEPKKIIQSEAFGGLSSVTVVAGNFGMAMNGTHYFEMFRFITDENPFEIAAWFSKESVPNPRGPQFMDRAGSVKMTTQSGKRFYMDIGADQGHGMLVVYAGHYGHLVVDELAGTMHLTVREEQYRSLPTTRYGMPNIRSVHSIPQADSVVPTKRVLDALLNSKNQPTGDDGRRAVAALVAAYISDENGHMPVKLDENDLPRNRIFPWA